MRILVIMLAVTLLTNAVRAQANPKVSGGPKPLASAAPAPSARGKAPDALDASTLLGSRYRVEPNVTYLTVNAWNARLDLYLPLHAPAPAATFVYFHGGGWVTGSKDEMVLDVLPYLAMGFAVVNVDYRLAQTALAPAAVEDCRCALRWVFRHAQQYGFDPTRIVVGGESAGGHLALVTAMAPAGAGLDRLCPGNEELKVAAVVNFFGIVDVLDILEGAHTRDFASGWFGQLPDREAIARAVSPIQYVRPHGPPVITIHGDADPVVPYEHAQRLTKALNAAGVPNQLVTIHGGKHGFFGGNDMVRSLRAIRQFLTKSGILKR